MTYRTDIQPRFFVLLGLLSILIAMCFKMACNAPYVKPQIIVPMDTILKEEHRILDSLKQEIEMRDATIANMRTEMQQSTGNVTKYVTKYVTASDTVTKIIACDSLAEYAQQLAEDCAELDSAYQQQNLTYKLTIETHEQALDICESNYSNVASQLQQSYVDNHFLRKQKRWIIAGGLTGIAITATVSRLFR